MGVGGISAETRARGQKLLAHMTELIGQYEGRGLGEAVDREVALLRRGCGRLELRMWRTSPLFCKIP
jgi:hypothetical protein